MEWAGYNERDEVSSHGKTIKDRENGGRYVILIGAMSVVLCIKTEAA